VCFDLLGDTDSESPSHLFERASEAAALYLLAETEVVIAPATLAFARYAAIAGACPVNTEGGLVVEWDSCDAIRCENPDASQVEFDVDGGSNSGGSSSVMSGSMIGLFVFVFCASMVMLVSAADVPVKRPCERGHTHALPRCIRSLNTRAS